ncbi:hypothetical protein Tco_0767135 [Tanacetum coccineum]
MGSSAYALIALGLHRLCLNDMAKLENFTQNSREKRKLHRMIKDVTYSIFTRLMELTTVEVLVVKKDDGNGGFDLSGVASCDEYECYALENQLLSVSLLICLGKHDCVERIPSRIVPNMIKKCSNPTSAISDETIANPNAQIVGDYMVRVKIPKCMSWLYAYDEPIGYFDMMEDKVDNPSPQSTPQVLLSFEVYTPSVTYSEEVEDTLGTPMEVEPLEET